MPFIRILPHVVLAALLTTPLFTNATSAGVIYRCEGAGAVTFSDRPCAPDAQEYEADDSRVSTYTAPSPAPHAPQAKQKQRPKRTTGGRSARDTLAKHAADCERLKVSLREIRAKMRSGYSAKEGERLKERRAKLEDRRRIQRCR